MHLQVLEVTKAEAGGCKYASLAITGEGAFGSLKFESGVHRVQRVPATESSGRIHTSTATVAVLPEAGEVRLPTRLMSHGAAGHNTRHPQLSQLLLLLLLLLLLQRFWNMLQADCLLRHLASCSSQRQPMLRFL